jgi:hypothetical protein
LRLLGFSGKCATLDAIGRFAMESTMRRLLPLLAALLCLGGCMSDRFTYAREDPFVWFLSGMPAPYDLNWQKQDVPDLPVLNPPDYAPPPPMQPLDYPRGWSPDYPPLIGPDAGTPAPSPDVDGANAPAPAPCAADCDAAPPVDAQPAAGDDAVPRDARVDDPSRG